MKPNSYEIIIWWSIEDAAYLAEVPELPGCMAHGTTRAKALSQAEKAIALWIKTAQEDGLAVPKARGQLIFA